MTPALIERLKALHARSTPGPWVVKGDCGVHGPTDEHGNPTMVIYDEGGHNRDDALCIAAIHNALPDLLAELSRLRQLREALESLMGVQNGPPLIQNEGEWREAMSAAYAALGETKK